MGRPKKAPVKPEDQINQVLEEAKIDTTEVKTEEPVEVPVNEMPLTSLREYRLYNERARKENKKLRINRYPIKQCPVELHPTQRVRITRVDGQGENVIPVFLSNHLIHYEKKLVPGEVYDIPKCVLHFLETRGHPVWKWFDAKNGAKETGISHYDPRFAISNIYSEVE